MSSHADTIDYKMVSTPASVQDVEDMSQYIHEAYSVAELLSKFDESQDFDAYTLTEIGKTIVRLLSQPMEASGQILSEKRDAAGGTVTTDVSLLATVDELYKNVADAAIILEDVPGERETCNIPENRTVTDCINDAMGNLDTIFDVVGNPCTRRNQPEADNGGAS